MDQRSPLTNDDYIKASQILGCEIAAIKAVALVESSGSGFFHNGHPKILFEGHIFHRYTKGIYDDKYPTISYLTWTTQHYKKDYLGEINRYELAASLNKQAAGFSASWGKFQIMGFNFALCQFLSLEDFLSAMHKDEQSHLKAFCYYLINSHLDLYLSRRDWTAFARRYNGPLYWKNRYDERLERAYVENR
jgi:hypothetical protein